MESFKLIVVHLLSPLSISLLLQLFGWWFFWRKKTRRSFMFLGSGTLILLAGSLSGLTFESRRANEFIHPPLRLAESLEDDRPVLAVVLGTGFNDDSEMPANSRVSGAFLARLLEGLRIARFHDDVRLLVSVAGDAKHERKQQFLNEMLRLLEIPPERGELISEAESTHDEADLVKARYRDEQLVLVTSAGHMPRAMTIFLDSQL
ncbi:MAG: hypothetical protein GY758_23840, partial [Fuerstiella sp.]|nr:hypothetical protein [Fuerstiella sp.]